MAEKKFRFELDVSNMKKQLDTLISQLNRTKKGMEDTGKSGSKSFSNLERFVENTQKKIRSLTSQIQKAVQQSSKASAAAIKANAASIKETQAKIQNVSADTANKLLKFEDAKRKSSRQTADQRVKDLNKIKNAESKAFASRMKAAQSIEKIRQKNAKEISASLKREQKLHTSTVNKQIKEREKLAKALMKQREAQQRVNEAMKAVLYVKIGTRLRDLVKQSALLAAQNEVLATAMNVVGRNMGFTEAQLLATQSAMRKMGISIKDSLTTIQRFAQASLTMKDATNLARAAQDLAAGSIHGSSEALETMTNSILSQLPRQLRQYGIVVNLNTVYREYGRHLKKSAQELNTLEKRQALLNVILDEADKRAGAYEESMKDVGKLLTSLSSRVIPDTMAVFGDFLLPLFGVLTKAVYDFLEALQDLDSGWQAIITVIISTISVFVTLKAALWAATTAARFFGTAITEAGLLIPGTSVAFTSLIGPITIVIGLLIAASAAWRWYEKSLDAAYNKSIENRRLMEDQEKTTARVIKAVKSHALTEKQLHGILTKQARVHVELRDVLKGGRIEREKLIPILEKIAAKQKIATEEARKWVSAEALSRYERLTDEHKKLQESVANSAKYQGDLSEAFQESLGFSKSYADAIVEAGDETNKFLNVVSSFLDVFAGLRGDYWLDNLKKAWQEFTTASSDVNENYGRIVDSSKKVEAANKDLENSYKEMADEAQIDLKAVEQEILKIEGELEKRAGKLEKQFPFEVMNKYYSKQEGRLKTLVDVDGKGLETRLKAHKLHRDELAELARKYTVFLAKLGQSELARLEIEFGEKIRKVRGSQEAETAVAVEFIQKRNDHFRKALGERLQAMQNATKAISDILQQRLDEQIQKERDALQAVLNDENSTLKERGKARKQFIDNTLALMESFQEQQKEQFREVIDVRLETLQKLISDGSITEEQYSEKVREINLELTEFHKENINKRIEFLRSAINEALGEEKRLSDEIKKLADERLNIERKGEDIIAKIQRGLNTKYQNYADDQLKIDELLEQAKLKLRENDVKEAKRLADESLKIASTLNKEITVGHGKQKRVIVSKHDASQVAIEKTKEATKLLMDINAEESRIAVKGRKDNIKLIEELQEKLKELTKVAWEAEIEIKGDAEKKIQQISDMMEKLDGKTISVYVNVLKTGAADVTKAAGEAAADQVGPGPINPIGEGSKPPKLARGKIDINGPGDERSDSILARLSKGESVITSKTTRMFKPLLELMEKKPDALTNMLVPALRGAMPSVAPVSSETMTFGNLNISINGVESPADFEGIDWRNVVRQHIGPQLKILKKRSSKI